MIESMIKPFIAPLQKKLAAPLKQTAALPKLAVKKAAEACKTILNAKEVTRQSYVPIGNYYVQKKLIVIVMLVLLALVYFIWIKPPAFVSRMFGFVPAFHEQSGTPLTYTGKAKVFDQTGWFKYEGELKDGVFQGPGKLYDPKGWLKRQGDFDKGQLASGEELGPDGTLLYRGGFAEGLYSGTGTLFHPNGKIRYQGEFQAGMPAGKGKAFDENGKLVYEGSFAGGLYSGEGTEYDSGGAVKYQGQFLAGKYNGAGKLLAESGAVLYEGGFTNGLYSGEGTEYFGTGSAKYKGAFMAGRYSGTGQAYYENGNPKYSGDFVAGVYSGNGEAFSEEGRPVYKGRFANGLYDGLGQQLGKDGKPTYLGFFRQGQPDYTAFLGMTGAKIEELLGKAPETTVVDTPDGTPELLMSYRNYRMAFTVKLSESDPQTTYIAAVKLTDPDTIEALAASFDERYRKLVKDDPKQMVLAKTSLSVSPDERRDIYIADSYVYRFLYSPAHTLKELEVSGSQKAEKSKH
ncbi:hypothetical protein ABEX47_07650 [Paenibacillus ehimensis]|uniref:hypothetical protein n=1 Tax=Paenibacillus ehimensis TaxID=79264 RepID=UPI003D27A96F